MLDGELTFTIGREAETVIGDAIISPGPAASAWSAEMPGC